MCLEQVTFCEKRYLVSINWWKRNCPKTHIIGTLVTITMHALN